jgi:hypothetical protein
VGGFVGYQGTGHLANSYSEGSVTATSAVSVQAGGFVGRTEGYNNTLVCCLSYETLSVSASGSGIDVGSFAGITPGGSYATIYSECHYDSTLSSFDRIGNASTGRGDGISGVATADLNSIANYDSAIWDFSGTRPALLWETSTLI